MAVNAKETKNVVISSEPKSALLVVDAQVGVLGSVWESKRLVGNIKTLVGRARESKTPIVWVQHSDQELKYGSESWKLADDFTPQPNELVIHKRYNSSFADTDLERWLREAGIKRIILTGAATNWCIRATAYSAMDRGYDIVIVSDGHSTENLQLADGTGVQAKDIIDEFNAVMCWISAPSVRVEVKTTSEVTF